ncbi:hypothetical protein BGZ76_003801 [Entomortierella beljakovae]|nr:hypothetical protein BGZ76_003801 [Entomortierella beljakovae]
MSLQNKLVLQKPKGFVDQERIMDGVVIQTPFRDTQLTPSQLENTQTTASQSDNTQNSTDSIDLDEEKEYLPVERNRKYLLFITAKAVLPERPKLRAILEEVRKVIAKSVNIIGRPVIRLFPREGEES